MSTLKVLIPLMLCAASVMAAEPLVAMRVDIETVASSDGATVAALIVQIAPEDRRRVGRRVWLEAELRREQAEVARVARVVELDRQGRASVELTLAPGQYALRAEISGATDDISGFWEGSVTVAGLEESEPLVPRETAAAEAGGDADPGAVAAPAATGVAATAGVEPAAAASGPGAAVRATAEPVAVPAPASDVEPEPAPDHEPAADAELAPEPELQSAPEPAPEPVAAPRPGVEPVVPPAVAAIPGPQHGSTPGWAAASAGLVDVTVVALAGNRPVSRLSQAAFELSINGRRTEIEKVGDASTAPLHLVLAVHVSARLLDEVAGALGLLALRAGGELCLVVADPDARVALDWSSDPAGLGDALKGMANVPAADLGGLVATALVQVAGRSGRSFVVVVTDGGDTTVKGDWERAAVANDTTGAQVMLVGFRDGLGKRSRRQLERMVEASGGKSYMIRDAGLIGMVLEHYGDLMQASYAVSWRAMEGAADESVKVKLKALGGEVELRHPERVMMADYSDYIVQR